MDQVIIENDLVPEWLSTAFVDASGQVYLPRGAFGNEMEALFALSYDNVPAVFHHRHI